MDERRDEMMSPESGAIYNREQGDLRSDRRPSSNTDPRTRRLEDTIENDRYNTKEVYAERKNRRPEQIEREIERTRAELSETINEIEERFSPKHIKQRFKEDMKHRAKGAGSSFVDLIRDNPVPSLFTGIGLTWLAMKGRERSSSDDYYESSYYGRYPGYERRRYRSAYTYGEPGFYGDEYLDPDATAYESDHYSDGNEQSMRSRAGDRSHEMKERASEMKHQASNKAREVQHRAGEVAHEAKERISRFGDQAGYRARRTKSQFEYQMEENPLAVGAIALGIGAAIGLMLPGTRKEDEWMGETRDNLVEEAKHRAENTFDQVKEVAKESTERMKEEVKSSAERIKDEAKGSAEQVKNTAKEESIRSSSPPPSSEGRMPGATRTGIYKENTKI